MTSVLPVRQESRYSYDSQPKVLAKNDCNIEDKFTNMVLYENRRGNLMFDRRVIRGNTYAFRPIVIQAQSGLEQRKKRPKRHSGTIALEKDKLRLPSVPPLEGRLHQPVQTELYLEELTDIIVEAETQCQTDAFLDRPPSPDYVPTKVGTDAETQIYEGELFDFDLEVTPMLQVLVGKTMEQALLEVSEEEELANIRAQQCVFEELRLAELVEVQRLMERDRRLSEERERRKQQQIIQAAREKELLEKVCAHAFSKAYLMNLKLVVFDNLAENGYFYDPVERDIEDGFLPWLMEEIGEELDLERRARTLLDLMIREVVQERHNAYSRLEAAEERQRLKLATSPEPAENKVETVPTVEDTVEHSRQTPMEDLVKLDTEELKQEGEDEAETEEPNPEVEEERMEEVIDDDMVPTHAIAEDDDNS